MVFHIFPAFEPPKPMGPLGPPYAFSVVPQEICEGLGVEMMGSEHCGLDDAWMVLPPGTKETKGAGGRR